MRGIRAISVSFERLSVGFRDEQDGQGRIALLPEARQGETRLLREFCPQDDQQRVAILNLQLSIVHAMGECGLITRIVKPCGHGKSELFIVVDNQDSTLVHCVGTHSVCSLAAKK